MQGKLLLPSAKSGILLEPPRRYVSPWWRRLAIVIGVGAIVVGGADAFSRLATTVLGSEVTFSSFAPAILLVDPELRGTVESARVVSFLPATVVIPAIGVDAAVEQVGVKANGAMDTPKAIKNVAWWKLGSKPGEPGNAVFAGHLNSALGAEGVFKNLFSVKPGDEVIVRGSAGEELTYVVEALNEYAHNDAPLDEIFAKSGVPGLVLITCEGTWDSSARTYDKRLVVVARLQNSW